MFCYLDEPDIFLKTIEDNMDRKNTIANEFYSKLKKGLEEKEKIMIVRYKTNGSNLRLEGKLFDATVEIMGDRTFGLLIFEIMSKMGLEYPKLKFIININNIELVENNTYHCNIGEESITFKFG